MCEMGLADSKTHLMLVVMQKVNWKRFCFSVKEVSVLSVGGRPTVAEFA
jgi:hypothetical protein